MNDGLAQTTDGEEKSVDSALVDSDAENEPVVDLHDQAGHTAKLIIYTAETSWPCRELSLEYLEHERKVQILSPITARSS
jgi:hypothetical protein